MGPMLVPVLTIGCAPLQPSEPLPPLALQAVALVELQARLVD
jgi:hypothetical protein